MRWKNEAGQAATESMMVISVVTIAVVAAGISFVPMFNRGVDILAKDVAAILETGDIGGNGGGGGGGSGQGTPGNNAGGTRNGSAAGFSSPGAMESSGNDVGSIPNRGPGSPDPRYVPPAPLVADSGSPIPGNDGGPIGTDPNASSGAFPANRGSLGDAVPLAGMTGRNFGAGPGL